MTYEHAIEILQEERDWAQQLSYVNCALNMAIEALKKQTLEKVEYGTDETAGGELYQYSRCPCCYNTDLIDNQKYCDECGQALKWGDEE